MRRLAFGGGAAITAAANMPPHLKSSQVRLDRWRISPDLCRKTAGLVH
jgi:hypothetical protein